MSCFFLIWNKLILHIRLMIYTQLIYLLLKDTLHIKYICHYWGIYREQLRLTTRHSMSKHEYKFVVLCIDIHFFSSSVELFWLSVRVTTSVGVLFEKIDWGNLGTSSSSPFMQKEEKEAVAVICYSSDLFLSFAMWFIVTVHWNCWLLSS